MFQPPGVVKACLEFQSGSIAPCPLTPLQCRRSINPKPKALNPKPNPTAAMHPRCDSKVAREALPPHLLGLRVEGSGFRVEGLGLGP